MTEVSFGEWLKRQRSGRGLTQQQLAQQIGCAVVTLRKIESEERRPSAQIVDQLAEIFEIPQNERRNFLKYARGDWKYAPGEIPAESPWQVPAKAARTNLPASVTPLIGREQQLREVHDYLLQAEVRLVTLIGPPGIGKTRLGIETARQSLSGFPEGVFFVELAQLDDPSLIASTTRQALGYVENTKLTADRQLQEGIGEKQILIVLDNCEHLIQAVAEFAENLLSACARLKMLVTSREALRISGEWLYAVPGLGIPEEALPVPAISAAQFPALILFAERARAIHADFVLTSDNISTVAEICTSLDGLPLAIELIAAQLRYFSPQALLERLNETFVLSVEGARTAPARQISLRHAFNWSYDSLTAEEQKVFASLAVFSGGFLLGAAQAILSEITLSKPIAELVASLLDKSLLRGMDLRGEIRFSMLATIRQFAQERLGELSEAEKIRDRHLLYFLEVAEQADREIHGPQQLYWFDRLEDEHDNMRAGLTWALERKKSDSGLRLAGGLSFFWFVHGYLNEGISWLERALSQETGASKAAAAKAYRQLGSLYLGGAERNPDLVLHLLERSLNLYEELEDHAGIAWVLNMIGLVAMQQNDYSKAKQYLSQSMILRHELGDPWGIAHTLQNFAPLALQENNYGGAKQVTEETIMWFRQAGDQRGVARSLSDLAELERLTGNPAQGITLIKQSLSQLILFKDKWSIASALEDLAALVSMQNDSLRAVRLYAAAKALQDTLGKSLPFPDYQRLNHEQTIARLRKNLDEATFAKAWAEGRSMTMEQVIEYALEDQDS